MAKSPPVHTHKKRAKMDPTGILYIKEGLGMTSTPNTIEVFSVLKLVQMLKSLQGSSGFEPWHIASMVIRVTTHTSVFYESVYCILTVL